MKIHFKFFCFLLATSIAFIASGQDSVWKNTTVTSDVAIFLPGPIVSLDTIQTKIVSSQFDGYYFQVKYLKQKLQVNNGDELMQAYDGFLSGYLNTKDLSIYTTVVSDTSLNDTRGEWVHSKYSKNNFFQEMYSYIVLVNSHFYMVTLASNHPINRMDPTIHKYFASLHFPITPIREYSANYLFQAKSYRNGQHIGLLVNSYFPLASAISIAILLLVLFYLKIYRKKKSKQTNRRNPL